MYRVLARLLAPVAACALAASATAFEIDGGKWPGGEAEFFTDLPGNAPNGIPWSVAVSDAIGQWNANTRFRFIPLASYRDPCGIDSGNSIGFTTDVCGSSFGSSTIAVTMRSWRSSILGPPNISRADIAINMGKNFNIYDGPLASLMLGSPSNPIDLRRVVLHELGHAIGLEHASGAPAIMNPTVGNIDRLQPDDIEGANTLYGGLSNCAVTTASFGRFSDALEPGDCTVRQLMVGGDDTSFIDVRRLELSTTTSLLLEMRAPQLDSVILLADERLRILDLDDNGGGGCDARLARSVPAGVYYVLSNTYHDSAPCGQTSGAYELRIGFTDSVLRTLGAPLSLLGSGSLATFSGGISADGGLTFANRFKPDDSLDITGRIDVDPRHRGQAGFLVIGAVVDGALLLKNAQGQWQEYVAGVTPLVKAETRILGSVENVVLVEDLVTRELGITSVTADFYFGYGVDSEPGEVHFHAEPINLVISP